MRFWHVPLPGWCGYFRVKTWHHMTDVPWMVWWGNPPFRRPYSKNLEVGQIWSVTQIWCLYPRLSHRVLDMWSQGLCAKWTWSSTMLGVTWLLNLLDGSWLVCVWEEIVVSKMPKCWVKQRRIQVQHVRYSPRFTVFLQPYGSRWQKRLYNKFPLQTLDHVPLKHVKSSNTVGCLLYTPKKTIEESN